jgi:hypothetical protein
MVGLWGWEFCSHFSGLLVVWESMGLVATLISLLLLHPWVFWAMGCFRMCLVRCVGLSHALTRQPYVPFSSLSLLVLITLLPCFLLPRYLTSHIGYSCSWLGFSHSCLLFHCLGFGMLPVFGHHLFVVHCLWLGCRCL